MKKPGHHVAILILLLFCDALDADWPQLRGPRGDGRSRQSSVLGRVANAKLQLRWKRTIGVGYSSVSTKGDRAVTAFDDGRAINLVCFSISTGNLLWKVKVAPHWVGQNGSFDGPIATPAIGFGNVYMLTPDGQLAAVELATGKRVWLTDVKKTFRAKPSYYGFGASPTLTDDHVLLPLGPPTGAICAFEPRTGKLAWGLGEDTVGYQTPTMMEIDGKQVLVCAGENKFFGVDLANPKILFSTLHQGKGGRGAWSLAPVPFGRNQVFLAHDDIGSKLIRIDSKGLNSNSRWNVEGIWKTATIRNSYNIPVVNDDHLYTYASRILTCIDRQGKTKWRSRKPGDGFISEVDDQLAILTKSGSLHLVNASPVGYRPTSSVDVFDDVSWSIPAIHGDSILVRSMNEIACVDIVVSKNAVGIESPQLVEPGATFSQFLNRIEKATDRQAEVDRFLANLDSTPLVEDGRIHFLLQGNHRDVAVGSDLFGARQERSMTKIEGTDLFYLVCNAPEKSRLSYVFIADFESIADPRNSNTFSSSVFVEDLELSVLVKAAPLKLSWFDTAKMTGGVEKPASAKLQKVVLNSKKMRQAILVSVLKPNQYSDQGPAWPVVFFHGGKEAISKGKMADQIHALMNEQRICPAVYVFVEYHYDPTNDASGYEAMISKELIPLIRSKFRVTDDRNSCCSIGGGFSGVLAMRSGLADRQTFGKIGILGFHHFHVHRRLIGKLASSVGQTCDIVIQSSRFALRNPDENWNMSILASEVVEFLNSKGHRAKLQWSENGTDWICWKLECEELLNHLLPLPTKPDDNNN